MPNPAATRPGRATHPPLGLAAVALASDAALCRRLSLGHGVSAMKVDKSHEDGSAPWSGVEDRIVSGFKLSPGETIIIIGDPRATDRESTISIHIIGRPTG